MILGTISFVAGGEVSFDRLGVHRDGQIMIPYGAFLTALVNLLLVALALFFVVKAYNHFARRKEQTPSTRPCPFCTMTMSRDATRCPACTSQVEPAPA